MPLIDHDDPRTGLPTTDDAARITTLRAELDRYVAELRDFSGYLKHGAGLEPDEVLLRLSSFHARASEIRQHITRNETRRANGFRTKELDPFLEACEFQFKVWSRLLSVRQLDWDMARGQG